MLHDKNIPILLAICLVIIGGPVYNVQAEGLEDFLINLCHDYPSWLAVNYPDPSPQLYNPINVSVDTEGLNLTGIFTDYQMFGHGNPENWECSNWFVDLSSGTIQMSFNIWRTRFGGKYQLEGTGPYGEVKGQGTWNVTTPYPSYITFGLNYEGVEVTPDNYVDLGTTGTVGSLYYYVPVGGLPVREMEGLVAGGEVVTLRNKVFDHLEMQTQYMMDHPLPIPLHTYLAVAFAGTPIQDM